MEFTDEFAAWWTSLDESVQARVERAVGLLRQIGPQLGAPLTKKVQSSRHAKMRELRVQYRGRPFRIFYAFDPRQHAILLTGGDKTGDGRFYQRMVRVADELYDVYLTELTEEGLI